MMNKPKKKYLYLDKFETYRDLNDQKIEAMEKKYDRNFTILFIVLFIDAISNIIKIFS